MQLFYCPGIKKGENFLDSEESLHCTKVLRKKIGDIIEITDGLGTFYSARLEDINSKKIIFSVITSRQTTPPNYYIHIAIAPTKNADRMEWFMEKAVEIGVDKVSFIVTENSERKKINVDRIKKKAVSAMKQSVRAFLPEISAEEKFISFIKNEQTEQKFIAHLEESQTPFLETIAKSSGNYLILIGPEGGFSDEEILEASKNNFQNVKIGNYRLRTETAGIVACTLLNQLNHSVD